MQIQNTVLDRRQHLGISRVELAEKTGLSIRTIYSIESEEDHNTKIKDMIKIAKALKVNSYWRLFTEVKS